LRAYAARRADGGHDSSQGVRRILKRALPEPAQLRLRTAATTAALPVMRRRASRLAGRSPLRLQFGAGRLAKEGWVNVDLVLGAPVDLGWDLRRPLPFGDGTIDAIFHEHLLEHLDLEAGLQLMEESHRVLRPGGFLRIGVPDAGAYAASYAQRGDGMISAYRPGRPTPMLALQEVFYLHGHRTMYDEETLALVLRSAGFSDVRRRSFGDSDIVPAPDTPDRAVETLYVEGIR
jgi:predicted SAM-dependent methyltransferase